MDFWTDTSSTELVRLGVAFVLCAVIGTERQVRQKAAGLRTHVLVGTGAAGFTLVSAYGFADVIGTDIPLDPSRIAAQVVSGIGFLGAGVIFMRRDAVRGLTTAATIWLAAAVGMAAGAGLLSLAVFLTVAHLLLLLVVGPLVARLPDRDHNRVVCVTYLDGGGVLRRILGLATQSGLSAFVLATRRVSHDLVRVDLRFKGRQRLSDFVPAVAEIPGVHAVSVRSSPSDGERDEVEDAELDELEARDLATGDETDAGVADRSDSGRAEGDGRPRDRHGRPGPRRP